MDKILFLLIQKIKKWSFLRVSIIVLGNLVIFGLGFALGLNYAQSIYLSKNESIFHNIASNNKSNKIDEKTSDEFSFFYGLKKTDNNLKIKNDYDRSIEKGEYKETKKSVDDKGIESRRNLLTTDSSGFTIQLYSFKSKDIAEKKIMELQKRGYSAYQSKIDLGNDDIYYRVRVGQFKSREEAERILVKILESETKEAYITRK